MTASVDAHQIHMAVESGHWGDLLRARAQGTPWSQLTNRQGIQALHQAVLMGETLIVKHFLQLEAPTASYTATNGQRYSPLWAALVRRCDPMAAELVQAGAPCREADPFEPHEAKREPLVFASQQHLVETTLALFQRGLNLRDLTADDRREILEAWLDHLLAAPVAAEQVFQQIEQTGWYPEGSEASYLEHVIQTHLRALDPGTGAGADRLLAAWRQRRSDRGHRSVERSRTPRERA